MIKSEKPESDYCYKPSVFGDGMQCPDYDGTCAMKPKCRKYNKDLSWNRSGRVLKCEECLGEPIIGTQGECYKAVGG